MNEIAYRQLTPHGWNVDIDKLRHAELFKAARRTAASREDVPCHCSSNMDHISLDSANTAVPYKMTLAEGWGRDHNDFRLHVDHGVGCFKGTVDLCYTVSGGRLESSGSLWWPKENGWWLHLDDHEHRDEDVIRSKTVVETFLRSVFPDKNYGIGDHRLITLTHQDAIKVVELAVDWFMDLRKHAPPHVALAPRIPSMVSRILTLPPSWRFFHTQKRPPMADVFRLIDFYYAVSSAASSACGSVSTTSSFLPKW